MEMCFTFFKKVNYQETLKARSTKKYVFVGSRLDGNFVKALCESISMGRTSYTEAYRLTNTSRKTFSEVAQHFGGMEW